MTDFVMLVGAALMIYVGLQVMDCGRAMSDAAREQKIKDLMGGSYIPPER